VKIAAGLKMGNMLSRFRVSKKKCEPLDYYYAYCKKHGYFISYLEGLERGLKCPLARCNLTSCNFLLKVKPDIFAKGGEKNSIRLMAVK